MKKKQNILVIALILLAVITFGILYYYLKERK